MKTETFQKFFRGDVVNVRRDRRTFVAVVLGSYFDKFAIQQEDICDDHSRQVYDVMNLKTSYPQCWFEESEMTKVKGRKVSERRIHLMTIKSLS